MMLLTRPTKTRATIPTTTTTRTTKTRPMSDVTTLEPTTPGEEYFDTGNSTKNEPTPLLTSSVTVNYVYNESYSNNNANVGLPNIESDAPTAGSDLIIATNYYYKNKGVETRSRLRCLIASCIAGYLSTIGLDDDDNNDNDNNERCCFWGAPTPLVAHTTKLWTKWNVLYSGAVTTTIIVQ